MRVDAVTCRGFGPLHDFASVGWADTGVVVLLGDNESGKSSLVDVVETCLFGFDGKKHSGDSRTLSVSLDVDGRRLHVERALSEGKLHGRVGGGIAWRDVGREPLEEVGSMDRATWRRLHCITVDGAADTAAWRDAERLLGSGRQLAAPGVIAARLEKEARTLWRRDRRGRPRARVLREELERLEAARDAFHERQRTADIARAARLERRRRAKATLQGVRRMLEDDLAELGRDMAAAKDDLQGAIGRLASSSRGLLREEEKTLARKILAVETWPEPEQPVPAWWFLATCLPAVFGGGGLVLTGLALASLASLVAIRGAHAASAADAALARVGLSRCGSSRMLIESWPRLVEEARAVASARRRRKSLSERRRARVRTLRGIVGEARAALAANRDEMAEREPSAPDFESEIAAVEDELIVVRRRHDRLMLSAAVLREVDDRIRKDVRPRLVAEASRLLEEITAGHRAIALEEGREGSALQLVTADGTSFPLEAASRGAREQVLLAVRLALIERAEQQGASARAVLPLILDDAFATWDPARRRAGARVLARVARTRQVIALTPDPAVAEAFRDACGARVVELSRTTNSESLNATAEP